MSFVHREVYFSLRLLQIDSMIEIFRRIRVWKYTEGVSVALRCRSWKRPSVFTRCSTMSKASLMEICIKRHPR